MAEIEFEDRRFLNDHRSKLRQFCEERYAVLDRGAVFVDLDAAARTDSFIAGMYHPLSEIEASAEEPELKDKIIWLVRKYNPKHSCVVVLEDVDEARFYTISYYKYEANKESY